MEGAPDGERWEIYTVLADSATASGPTEVDECSCGAAQAGDLLKASTAGCC